MYRDYYMPPRECIINMEQFRKDYTKVKNMTNTTTLTVRATEKEPATKPF